MSFLMKACSKCERMLPLTDFYQHPHMADGRMSSCKDCRRAYARAHPHPKRHVGPHPATPYDPARKAMHSKAWYEANKVKAHAKTALGRAVAAGKVKRLPCRECGSKRSQGHHEDYSKPLEVVWLCALHHMRLHRAREAAST